MINPFRNITLSIVCLTFLLACGSSERLYRTRDNLSIATGTLADSTYNSLRQLLSNKIVSPIKDTIIIKYDYNNESCWNLLDQQDDSYIQGFLTRSKERAQTLLLTRPNASVLNFREPGNNLNKLKKWDSTIIIDDSKQLMNLLFKDKATCGNSIIVVPDKRFVFIRSDSHFMASYLAQAKILEYLASK
ncbi:MAG: hypothetical protein K0S09_570 [Sphingobacteriaceae bacterium]|jgi:hypothetical protein|nr:hypothetical protein [Sphingobacteriaceae bacterium]